MDLLDNCLNILDPLSGGVDGLIDKVLENTFTVEVYEKKFKKYKNKKAIKQLYYCYTNVSRTIVIRCYVKPHRYRVVKNIAKGFNK